MSQPQEGSAQQQLGSQQELHPQELFLPNSLSSKQQLFFLLQQLPQEAVPQQPSSQPQDGSQQQPLSQPQLGSAQQQLGSSQQQLGSQQELHPQELFLPNSLSSKQQLFFLLQQLPHEAVPQQPSSQPQEGSQQQPLSQPQLGSAQQQLGSSQQQLGSQQELQPQELFLPNSLSSKQQPPDFLQQLPHEAVPQQPSSQPQLGSQQQPLSQPQEGSQQPQLGSAQQQLGSSQQQLGSLQHPSLQQHDGSHDFSQQLQDGSHAQPHPHPSIRSSSPKL